MTQATQATLTKEEMLDNVHIVANELHVRSMAINRQGLAQVHTSLFGHTHELEFRLYASDAVFARDKAAPEMLGKLNLHLRLREHMGDESMVQQYYADIQDAEHFKRQLDQIQDHNRPLVAR